MGEGWEESGRESERRGRGGREGAKTTRGERGVRERCAEESSEACMVWSPFSLVPGCKSQRHLPKCPSATCSAAVHEPIPAKHYAKSDQWSVSSYSCVRINMCIMWSIVNGQHLLMNVCKPHVAVEEAVAENAGKKHHLHALVTVYDDSYSYLTCKTTAGSAIAVSMPTG